MNAEWNAMLPEATVFHLEKVQSDHCLIKLCFENNREFHPPRPFRFQPMWLSHPTFPGVVREAWNNPPSLQQALSDFTIKANSWNQNQFGNLFHRKKRILARLKGIQESLSISPCPFLVDLEGKLRMEYAEVANLEEEFWALKARILWLVEGDRNTSFYHTSALVRRRRNRILCMKDRVGNWLNGEREIADFIRKGFSELFSSSQVSSSLADWDPPFWKIHLKEDDLTHLNLPVSDEEILAGLWALKPFKSPGPNGLHVGFFHRFWLVVGDSVRKEVKSIFLSRVILDYLNQNLITLIPKCKILESLSNYRPISLCNSIYKVVTKIIVGRIRPFLNDLVSPLQSAFVPGRKGVDNAIIVQELIHSMKKKKKGRTGVMAIKIDLEKSL